MDPMLIRASAIDGAVGVADVMVLLRRAGGGGRDALSESTTLKTKTTVALRYEIKALLTCPNSHAVLSDRSSGSDSVAITRRMLLLLVLLVLLRLWLLSTAVCRSQRRILGVQSLRGRVVLLLLLLMLLLMMMLLICSHTITLEIGSELI